MIYYFEFSIVFISNKLVEVNLSAQKLVTYMYISQLLIDKVSTSTDFVWQFENLYDSQFQLLKCYVMLCYVPSV